MTAFPDHPEVDAREELAAFDALRERKERLEGQLSGVIVGHEEVIEGLLVAAFCHEHALLVGVPGLAKTLLVRTLAASLHLEFRRIQFTPDMMPSDILGAEILQTDPESGERRLRFSEGPIFAQIILADEINRAPPKTQSALLEAMAERQVTVGGRTRRLEAPFIVVATQNPIEQEGAYPLPEAQLDRFMLCLNLEYPTVEEEQRIAAEADAIRARAEAIEPLFDAEELSRLRRVIGRVPVADHVTERAVAITRATRPEDSTCPKDVQPYVRFGAGPRAAQAMLLGARCLAAFEGEPSPLTRHVERIAPAALRRRLVLSYAAHADGVDEERIIDSVLRSLPRMSD